MRKRVSRTSQKRKSSSLYQHITMNHGKRVRDKNLHGSVQVIRIVVLVVFLLSLKFKFFLTENNFLRSSSSNSYKRDALYGVKILSDRNEYTTKWPCSDRICAAYISFSQLEGDSFLFLHRANILNIFKYLQSKILNPSEQENIVKCERNTTKSCYRHY